MSASILCRKVFSRLTVLFLALCIICISAVTVKADTYFYVDPDYQGAIQDGTAANPWYRLKQSQFDAVNAALAQGPVTVFFSAREADKDSDELSTEEVRIYRTNQSTNRLTLDAMSKYNTNDQSPSWADNTGSSRYKITAGYAMSTGQVKRNYITIRGFKIVAGEKDGSGYGGQIINYWGGDHVIIEHNDLSHSSKVTHGAGLQFGYAHKQKGGGSGSCTDIIIRNNVVHDTYGECIYLGGSEDTGLPAHSNILVENNITFNCGIYGGQGDCIDPKDGITDLVIRKNICFNGYGDSNINGIPSSSPITATENVIYNMPNKGISLGTYWGLGHSGSLIANNLIYNNGTDGIYLGTNTPKPLTGIKILNNTIVGNGESGLVLGSGNGFLDDLQIKNNIIMNHKKGVSGWGWVNTLEFSHNNVYGNTKDYAYNPISNLIDNNGNISQDPLFVDIANDDYHLSVNSPCIDKGTDSGLSIDLDGIPRPLDEGYEMGCYEYLACTSVDYSTELKQLNTSTKQMAKLSKKSARFYARQAANTALSKKARFFKKKTIKKIKDLKFQITEALALVPPKIKTCTNNELCQALELNALYATCKQGFKKLLKLSKRSNKKLKAMGEKFKGLKKAKKLNKDSQKILDDMPGTTVQCG